MNYAHDSESTARLIAKVIRDMTATMRFDSFADFKETLRRRLTRLRIAYTPADFDEAITVVASNHQLWGTSASRTDPVAVSDSADPPLTREEAAHTITRIREHLHRDVKIPTVPQVRVRQLSRTEMAARVHRTDRERALRLVLDAIADVAAHCDELERKP